MSMFKNKSQQAANNLPALAPITLDVVKESVPPHLRANVTQNLVDTLNQISVDPIAAENIRDNFVSYSSVMKEGKFKLEDYLNAVAYVSYKIMGDTNQDAYAKTFPARFQALIAAGKTQKEISSYVAAYNKNKLVNMILEQTLVPSWVLNQDLHQRALNVQADLMVNAQSEKVRTDAANSILTHLQKPKEGNFQINVGESMNSGIKEMRETIRELAANQQKLIENGNMKTIDVAAQRIRFEEDE